MLNKEKIGSIFRAFIIIVAPTLVLFGFLYLVTLTPIPKNYHTYIISDNKVIADYGYIIDNHNCTWESPSNLCIQVMSTGKSKHLYLVRYSSTNIIYMFTTNF